MKNYVSLFLAFAAPAVMAAEPSSLMKLTPQQIEAFGIKTAAIQPADQAVSKTYPAKVAVPNSKLRVVSAPLDGVVEALLVAEGENVQVGQALAQIRSARLLELQTAYLESRTRRLLSEKTVQRDRKLKAEGIIAERRLLEAESNYRQQKDAEERDLQALKLAGMPDSAVDELTNSRELSAVLEVKAPLEGVVLEQIATAGQRLAAADPLYRVGDLSTLWIEVHVPLKDLEGVAPGSQAELPEQNLRAEIITVGRMVHGTDQGVLVRAAVTEGAEKLRPGQFVGARLYQRSEQGAWRVPSNAMVRQAEKAFVFIKHADGFAAVPVELLAREEGQVLVRADLKSEDAVVVQGAVALKALLAGGNE